jgi:hypothetical protein
MVEPRYTVKALDGSTWDAFAALVEHRWVALVEHRWVMTRVVEPRP